MSTGGRSLVLSGVAGALVSLALHAQSDTTIDRVRTGIARQYPCSHLSFTLDSVPGGLPRNACSIAKFAAHQIASGSAQRIGVRASDTTAIRSATVRLFHFEDLNGGPPETYWLVAFVLRNRTLAVDVRIDGTGAVSVSNGEGSAETGAR